MMIRSFGRSASRYVRGRLTAFLRMHTYGEATTARGGEGNDIWEVEAHSAGRSRGIFFCLCYKATSMAAPPLPLLMQLDPVNLRRDLYTTLEATNDVIIISRLLNRAKRLIWRMAPKNKDKVGDCVGNAAEAKVVDEIWPLLLMMSVRSRNDQARLHSAYLAARAEVGQHETRARASDLQRVRLEKTYNACVPWLDPSANHNQACTALKLLENTDSPSPDHAKALEVVALDLVRCLGAVFLCDRPECIIRAAFDGSFLWRLRWMGLAAIKHPAYNRFRLLLALPKVKNITRKIVWSACKLLVILMKQLDGLLEDCVLQEALRAAKDNGRYYWDAPHLQVPEPQPQPQGPAVHAHPDFKPISLILAYTALQRPCEDGQERRICSRTPGLLNSNDDL